MKKILLALVVMLGLTTATFAQDKKADKAASAQKAPVNKLKADGSPDMRYKENKENTKKAGPKKADGTPDMRFKANKGKG